MLTSRDKVITSEAGDFFMHLGEGSSSLFLTAHRLDGRVPVDMRAVLLYLRRSTPAGVPPPGISAINIMQQSHADHDVATCSICIIVHIHTCTQPVVHWSKSSSDAPPDEYDGN